MSALRLTIVSRIYSPEPSAGSLRLQALADELVRQGHAVEVVTARPPRGVPIVDRPGERVRRWPVLRDKDGYVRGYLQYLSYDIPLFFRILFSARPDAYIVEPPPTTGMVMRVAAFLRRRPYIYYAADIWSDAAHMTGAAGWVIGAVRMVEKRAIASAAENLVVSEGVDARIAELAPGASTHVVGHGIDTDLFSPDGPGTHTPADIVYVGTMSEWHGARLAIDALAEVMRDDKDVTAVFIGQGAERDGMREAVADFGLEDRIRFLDAVPADQAVRWLRSARVALATLRPGAGYDFAVPTKLYAALATGTPVAYAGPQALRDLIVNFDLGEASRFEAHDYAVAISRLLDRTDGAPVAHLAEWAVRNVSARAVAQRSTDAVVKAVRA